MYGCVISGGSRLTLLGSCRHEPICQAEVGKSSQQLHETSHGQYFTSLYIKDVVGGKLFG